VPIDADGNWSIDGGAPYVTGTLPVESLVPAGMYQDVAQVNAAEYESENNLVVVEVFYDHELLLGTRMGAQIVGLGPLRLYSRSINRIGVSRYE
jgi:hypothetical protein